MSRRVGRSPYSHGYWVDGAARSSCDESLPQRLWPHHNVPVFVHYCQGYRFPDTTANTKGHKELVFGKRRIPHDVFASCAGDRLPRLEAVLCAVG